MRPLALVPRAEAVACAYVRISDDRTGENASIARQKQLIRALAERLEVDPDAIRWFEDKSKSASHGMRPAFVELLAAVRNGEASTVLVWVADRLWRNDDDQHEIRRTFRAAKIKVRAAQGNDLDFTTAEGRFTGTVVGAASNFEVERKGERVELAAKDRAKKGRFGGGVRRFGYRQRDTRIARQMDEFGNVTEVERPSGPLVLVPEEAAAIADGYRMILEGASLNAVTRDWRARGLRGVQGGPLTPMVVRGTLLRPANAGISTYKGEVVGTGEWPAITDPDTYATVKALLLDPSRRTNVGRPAIHLLSGILRCGTCGGRMLAGSKARGQTYRCRSGRQLPETKPGLHSSRRRGKLEDAISELIVSYLVAHAAQLNRPTTAKSKTTAAAIAEAAKLRAKIDAYLTQAADFEPSELAVLLRGLRTRLQAEEAKIVKAAGTPATHTLISQADIAVAWNALSTSDKRTVIKEQIDRIVVGPGKSGSGNATMHNVQVFNRDGYEITPAASKAAVRLRASGRS